MLIELSVLSVVVYNTMKCIFYFDRLRKYKQKSWHMFGSLGCWKNKLLEDEGLQGNGFIPVLYTFTYL